MLSIQYKAAKTILGVPKTAEDMYSKNTFPRSKLLNPTLRGGSWAISTGTRCFFLARTHCSPSLRTTSKRAPSGPGNPFFGFSRTPMSR